MIKGTALAAGIGALSLFSTQADARCGYVPPVGARNFSAFFYQSPGGVGRPGYPSRIYGYRHARVQAAEPYPHACGSGRHWNGKRCFER
jgi:hypothetical protein